MVDYAVWEAMVEQVAQESMVGQGALELCLATMAMGIWPPCKIYLGEFRGLGGHSGEVGSGGCSGLHSGGAGSGGCSGLHSGGAGSGRRLGGAGS
ncbi:hypothetical protein QQF64_023684 [Cirrhinus molitorella]|uniref:Uncharacterized protein n=1 Tax=Cirrhinus molitorella TaxID=172907 RepID=A0ABR3NGU1_9TELE